MYRTVHSLLVSLFAVILLASCSSDSSTNDNDKNSKPLANAGQDQTVTVSNVVNIIGHGQDQDNDTLTYLWEFTARPQGSAAALVNPTAAATTFVPDKAGMYKLRLTITDGTDTVYDECIITVEGVTAQDLGGYISTDTHLHNIFDDPSIPDYLMIDNVNVLAELRIDPGVKILVKGEYSLSVNEGGSIIAIGLPQSMIEFTAETASEGYWSGITINSNNPKNELSYVEVAYGGAYNNSNVVIKDDAQLKLTHSVLRNSKNFGFDANSTARINAFAENTFSRNLVAPVNIWVDALGRLDNLTDYGADNGSNMIHAYGQNIDTAQTWHALNVPVMIFDNAYLNVEVTIEAGTQLVFENDTILAVNEEGAIRALGTAAAPIIMKGAVETPGYWEGVLINSNNPKNELTYVQIAHGGQYDNANITVMYNGQVGIKNCTISDGLTYGFKAEDEAKLTTFSNNTFTGNLIASVQIPSNLLSKLDGASHYAGGNGDDYIEVFDSTITGNHTWQKTDAPVYFITSIFIEGDITVNPGARYLFADSTCLCITSDGSLSAVGTDTDAIVFTGEVETEGYWSGIYIESNDPANHLSHVDVAYGGADEANVTVRYRSHLTLENSYIHHSNSCGVYVEDEGSIALDNNTYSDNASNDVILPTE